MEPKEEKEEELKFEDSSEIISNRGSLKDRQTGFRRRVTSKKLLSQPELLKRIDIDELRTPSIDQRAKIAQMEQKICEAVRREGAARTEEDLNTLDTYLSETVSFRGIKAEYDPKVARQFLRLICLVEYKPGDDLLKYRNPVVNIHPIDAANEYFFYIIGGQVSVMAPTRVIKAFATDSDFAAFRKQNKPCIVRERKLRVQDLDQVITTRGRSGRNDRKISRTR